MGLGDYFIKRRAKWVNKLTAQSPRRMGRFIDRTIDLLPSVKKHVKGEISYNEFLDEVVRTKAFEYKIVGKAHLAAAKSVASRPKYRRSVEMFGTADDLVRFDKFKAFIEGNWAHLNAFVSLLHAVQKSFAWKNMEKLSVSGAKLEKVVVHLKKEHKRIFG